VVTQWRDQSPSSQRPQRQLLRSLEYHCILGLSPTDEAHHAIIASVRPLHDAAVAVDRQCGHVTRVSLSTDQNSPRDSVAGHG
jgi:hypothetical protein